MSKQKKVWLGIASVIPLVLMLAYLVLVVVNFATMDYDAYYEEDEPTWFWIVTFGFIGLSILSSWAMLAYYIVWLFRIEPADDSKKTLWIVLLLMLQGLALPIFWFLFIWREESLAPKPPPWAHWQQPYPPQQWQQPQPPPPQPYQGPPPPQGPPRPPPTS